jgi:hypothetical protein
LKRWLLQPSSQIRRNDEARCRGCDSAEEGHAKHAGIPQEMNDYCGGVSFSIA